MKIKVALNNITPTPFFELPLLIAPFVIFKLFKIKLLAEYKLGGYHISKLITIITEDFHPTILILLAHYWWRNWSTRRKPPNFIT
jgi:hypothetical protein